MNDNSFVYIIINGIQPYINEINSILAPQNGVTTRVRYKLSWIPEIKRNKLNDLKGKKGFVILRNFNDPETLIPLRSIKIKNVTLVGEVAYIEFYLENHINFSAESELMNDQLKRVSQMLAACFNQHKYPNIKGKDLKNLIFFGADIDSLFDNSIIPDQVGLWGVLIEYLSNIKKNETEYLFEDFDFIKIVCLKDNKGSEIKISYNKKYNDITGAYEIESDSKIYFEILQRTFTRKHGDSAVETPRRINIAFYDKYLLPARSNAYIVGKYDLITLSLITAKTESQVNAEAFIEISRDNRVSSPIVIPLVILQKSSQKIQRFASIVIFILSFACYLLSEKLALKFPEFLTKETIKDFLLPVLILSGSNLIPNVRDFILGRLSLN